VRILVTTNAAVGHLAALAPTVQGLLAAGHDVRVGCPAAFAAKVRAAGFVPMACAEQPVEPIDLSPPPREARAARFEWSVTVSWPAAARTWAAALVVQAANWRPAVVVVEPVEHAGRVTAAALGVPLVEHGWGFTLPAGMTDAGSRGLLDVYAQHGATPAEPAMRVDLGVASMQAADTGAVARYRYLAWAQPGEALPEPDGRPRILVTLGTFGNPDAAHRIRAIVSAAHECGAQVIAVLGNPDRHSAEVFPAGTAALDWVDLPAAVASSDLVIHHGGAGTSWATLAAGCPAVVVPQLGDQFRNAGLLGRAGVAVCLDPSDLVPVLLRQAIERVLGTPSFAERAGAVATENSVLPDAARLASDIVALA